MLSNLDTAFAAGRMSRRQLLRGALLTGGALTLSGLIDACGSAGTPAAVGSAVRAGQGNIRTFTAAMNGPVLKLDTRVLDPISTPVTLLGLEPLMQSGPGQQPVPCLAAEYHSPDARTFIYRIRSGVRFWDGTPLTIEDVVFSLQLHTDPNQNSQLGFEYDNVASIRATGPDEVTIKLKQPDAIFAYTPAFTGILSKRYFQAHASSIGTPGTLNMGTGAFRFAEFVPQQSVTLVRNEHYWGVKPSIETLRVTTILDDNTRLLAAQSNQIDAAFYLPLSQVSQWQATPGWDVSLPSEHATTYFAMNVTKKPIEDVRVRRAIAHSINREGIGRAAYGGFGTPGIALTPQISFQGILPDSEIKIAYQKLNLYPYDLDAARRELAQSSTPNGFTLDTPLTYGEGETTTGLAAQILASDLKKIGINVTLKQVPAAEADDIRFNDKPPISVDEFVPDTSDPIAIPKLIVPAAGAVKGGLNTAQYTSPRAQALIDKARATVDLTARARVTLQLLTLLQQDLPYAAAYHPAEALGLSTKFAFPDYFYLWYLTPWWASRVYPAA
jgi:peptide/nickel transport system substrate-binding protein